MNRAEAPLKQGLYDPLNEHDACGVGFVVDLKGRKTHAIVQQAIQILGNMEHRGACGCEKNTGDGAGIIIQMPHQFLAKKCDELGIRLPGAGEYGVGMLFVPTNPSDRQECETLFEKIVREEGQTVLGWRIVPTDNSMIGPTAQAAEPGMRQLVIARQEGLGDHDKDNLPFERKLYVIRRRVENAVRESSIGQRGMF